MAKILRIVHAKDPPADLRTYIESTPNGWWYTAPIPRQETVAVFFTGTEQIRTAMAGLLFLGGETARSRCQTKT